jgi:aspartate/methionine/tyrosine aminotransferase
MKLGWIVTGGPAPLQRAARERLELIADTYLSVGTPVQHAAPRLLAAGDAVQRGIRERTRRNRERAAPLLRPLGVEGGWYIIVPVPRTRGEDDWTIGLLRDEGVLVQPGYFYDFEGEGRLVISLLTEPGVFDEGTARLARYLNAAG